MRCVSVHFSEWRRFHKQRWARLLLQILLRAQRRLMSDFCNKIGHFRTHAPATNCLSTRSTRWHARPVRADCEAKRLSGLEIEDQLYFCEPVERADQQASHP